MSQLKRGTEVIITNKASAMLGSKAIVCGAGKPLLNGDPTTVLQYESGDKYRMNNKHFKPVEETVKIPPVQEWGCFQQVADVIGEENAVKELSKIKDIKCIYDIKQKLRSSFHWGSSPQHHEFWRDIDRGYLPKQYNLFGKGVVGEQTPDYIHGLTDENILAAIRLNHGKDNIFSVWDEDSDVCVDCTHTTLKTCLDWIKECGDSNVSYVIKACLDIVFSAKVEERKLDLVEEIS